MKCGNRKNKRLWVIEIPETYPEAPKAFSPAQPKEILSQVVRNASLMPHCMKVEVIFKLRDYESTVPESQDSHNRYP
jgi:hypothetical protein